MTDQDQVRITCKGEPEGWNHAERGEPRHCWYVEADGERWGPYETRQAAFAAAEAAWPGRGIG